VVPADKNIFFHALDENLMAVQKERTFVNYRPGETRSCIGCHETPTDAATASTQGVLQALRRPASVPGPQPGDASARRVIDYVQDVQPVLDKHCVRCHGGEKTEKGLTLTGEMTQVFNVSYESLLNKKYMPFIGENYPKTGNVHYLPTRSLGAHNSLLVAMLAPEKVRLPGAPGEEAILSTQADLRLGHFPRQPASGGGTVEPMHGVREIKNGPKPSGDDLIPDLSPIPRRPRSLTSWRRWPMAATLFLPVSGPPF
jgi:hypothetical protein